MSAYDFSRSALPFTVAYDNRKVIVTKNSEEWLTAQGYCKSDLLLDSPGRYGLPEQSFKLWNAVWK